MKLNKFIILFVLTSLLGIRNADAQDIGDTVAFRILDKALGFIIDGDGATINFDGLAYGLSNPKDIFTLPAYKVYRGGYWIMNGTKFEMKMGDIKGLSDGKLMVIVNEQDGIMYIDSVRTGPLVKGEEMPNMEDILFSEVGDIVYTYNGIESVYGEKCHSIRGEMKGPENIHVLYWVGEKSNKLVLMAEWAEDSYNVYWIRSIGKAPLNHKYDIYLPSTELDKYLGLQVIDMRFASEDMR